MLMFAVLPRDQRLNLREVLKSVLVEFNHPLSTISLLETHVIFYISKGLNIFLAILGKCSKKLDKKPKKKVEVEETEMEIEK